MLKKLLLVLVIVLGTGLCGKIALRHSRENQLAAAVTQHDAAAVERLLSARVDPNSHNHRGTPLLSVALTSGDSACARALLKAGADVHHPHYGYQLLRAVEREQRELVLALIAHGCSLTGTDMNGQTPLMYAASTHNFEIAEILIKAGADLERHSKPEGGGCTPLMYAATAGDAKMIELLLRYGAQINAHSFQSKTALCYALERNQPEALKALLDKGAGREEINAEKQDALTVAQNLKRPKLIALLQSETSASEKIKP